MILSLVGCESEKLQSFRYESKDITAIEIETGATSVSVLKNMGNNIEVSYTREVTTGNLTIKTEYGDITMLGLKGNIETKADMETKQTDLSIGCKTWLYHRIFTSNLFCPDRGIESYYQGLGNYHASKAFRMHASTNDN